MAMYYCLNCDNLLDDDYHPACEHPWRKDELVCPDCESYLQYEMTEAAREDHYEPTERDEWESYDPDC